jgi:hypothetical protein
MMWGQIIALSAFPESEEEAQLYTVAQRSISSSTASWALKVPSGTGDLWFLVYLENWEASPSTRYFITSSASGASSVPLDIEAMTELPIGEE